ncbi:MAG: hypothetical protein AAF630_02160, partial [Cyanobacteria bacterium P01_C01_bin.38]
MKDNTSGLCSRQSSPNFIKPRRIVLHSQHIMLYFIFQFVGLKLQGASCSANALSLVDTIISDLADIRLQWLKIDQAWIR